MKKKSLWIILAVILFVVMIGAYNWQWIYYRAYPFDRITGSYEITVNGSKVTGIEEYYANETYDGIGKIRLENDTENFTIKGGMYGPFYIGFVLDDDEIYRLTNDEKFKGYGDVDIQLTYFNTNWWNISKLDIKIDITKENGEWYACYDVELEQPTEDFERKTYNESRKIKVDELGEKEFLVFH